MMEAKRAVPILAIWLTAVMLAFCGLQLASGHAAAAGTVTLSPTSGQTGTNVTATWTGFAGGSNVTITDLTVGVGTLCSAGSDGSGGGHCSFTISSTEANTGGAHTIQASGGASTDTASLTITA